MKNDVSRPDTIFDKAKSIIYGDRERVYGDPGKNIRAIGELWHAYLNASRPHEEIGPFSEAEVCAMMRLLKEARLINSPDHEDSLIDVCGYAGVQQRIYEHPGRKGKE